MALSGDGKTLVSGSGDKTVKVWDVGTGQERATFKGHTAQVTSVALSGDGQTLATGDGWRDETDGAYLWRAALPVDAASRGLVASDGGFRVAGKTKDDK